MKANRKFINIDGEEAVSAVIGVILMVAITVAIAATVYVYVSGMIGTTNVTQENASVTVSATPDGRIRVTLAGGGQRYDSGSGYDNFRIQVEGTTVKGIDTGDSWFVGEAFIIGAGYDVDNTAPLAGLPRSFSVTVTILDSVVYDGSVRVTG